MCTGLEALTLGKVLAAGSALASTANGFAQARQQTKAAERSAAIANQNHAFIVQENQRLQREVREIETEQISDRERLANQELATIQAAAGEMGIANLTPFVVEVGANEGIDISRIERNAENEVQRIQAQSKSSQLGTLAQIQGLREQSRASSRGALFNAIGSGLQLGKDLRDISKKERET